MRVGIAFGNINRIANSHHTEPYISNSGDLTRDKIAELIEMTMNND